MHTLASLSSLSDAELIIEVTRSSAGERQAMALLIASLGELDARRLYLGEGCSSLFTYCTQVLHLSEHAAYGRIEAARAARRFPILLELLADGSINLTTVGLLGPHLSANNHREVLEAARRKSKRDVEHLVARLRPQHDVVSSVRKLPGQRPSEVPSKASTADTSETSGTSVPVVVPPPSRPVMVPLAERYKVQFTVSRETYDKLRRAQDLLWYVAPNGDPAVVFDRALTTLLEDLEGKKHGSVARPRPARATNPASRRIPAAVKREVWKRDAGRCAFVGTAGRCSETGCLEFHHVQPFAEGGPASVENIELRCRAHNAYEAEQCFGSFLVRERSPVFESLNSVWTELG